MNTRDNKLSRQKKAKDQIRILGFAVIVLLLLSNGFYGWAVASIPLFYLIHEALWADHIFYNPHCDYLYRFKAGKELTIENQAGDLVLRIDPNDREGNTALLALEVRSQLLGCLFDPYIELETRGKRVRQYFERNAAGLRYVNVSHLIDHPAEDAPIIIRAKFLRINGSQCRLHLFANPKLDNKRILIVAPHADDAELAAFGLYSDHESMIVTITAGEVDAEKYRSIHQEGEKASLLKGRLRALDAVSAALWGGVNQKNIINLGYFCLQLKKMHDNPSNPIRSKTAAAEDTRIFRQLNKTKLKSDQNGLPTWNNLVGDLKEILEDFRPDFIVTPHPGLDPHGDHIYATKAVLQAIDEGVHIPGNIFFYANHYHYTDQFPFGPEHTVVSLPPNFNSIPACEVFSYPLDADKQKEKACALLLMHELRDSRKLKIALRRLIQSVLIGRPVTKYGQDDYYRKAVRENELFFWMKSQDLSSNESHEAGKAFR